MAEAPAQLLSLKVMRVSRPTLATAWEPFYSSSSSFSAHSTASVVSLQGKNPLPGHPKTLRDLTHITEMLTLPSAFGNIQLGETFSSCLSVNNEATQSVHGVSLRVEMQTATAKTILAEYGGPDFSLQAGDTLERVVEHEIKELGQHVLACTVSYNPSPGRHSAYDTDATAAQSFRKFYKFSVTNPLSVKTKVHVPRSPSALLSPAEREKVFLEVHIQNLTPDALWLQRMKFECAEGWDVIDANIAKDSPLSESITIFTGAMAQVQPQDTRQYIYILSPKVIPPFPVTHSPGSIIPLGRLDISWRSSFGEPGRLLTSMLSRRIPLVQVQQGPNSSQPPIPPPKPALPLHLQRSNTVASTPSSRGGSPHISQRPLSPPIQGGAPIPYRPDSPFRRTPGFSLSSTPQSPNPPPPPPIPNNAVRRPEESIDADLVVRYLPRDDLIVEKPFKVEFSVTISAPIPVGLAGQPRKDRIITLAIQHVLPARPQTTSAISPVTSAGAPDLIWSPKLPSSGFSTPSPYGTPARGDFPDTLAQRLLHASPRQSAQDIDSDGGDGHETGQATPAPPRPSNALSTLSSIVLPPPFAVTETNPKPQNVVFLGPSTTVLPSIRVPVPSLDFTSASAPGHDRTLSEVTVTTDSEADSDLHETIGGRSVPRMLVSQEFSLEFLPVRAGFATVGGVRVLLVEDRLVDTEGGEEQRPRRPLEARTLKEWDVVAEVWVNSQVA
ncbi:hypothetical protein BDY19DRAFT_896735 [Irpex rosettiformis]|uniref:Uncharacterized protein n=1 Tax=Irpex rosettiformis TaxID=378272 RepID=A0ACB8TUD7_9APHY|nr:hypothetical protein BDY19DRAFT_896735 [Irpex rosettiformis]